MDRNQTFKQTVLAHSVNEPMVSSYLGRILPHQQLTLRGCVKISLSHLGKKPWIKPSKKVHISIFFGYFWPKGLTTLNIGTSQDEIFEHFLLILLNPHLLSDTTLPLCFYPLQSLLTVWVTRAAQNTDESRRQVRVNSSCISHKSLKNEMSYVHASCWEKIH